MRPEQLHSKITCLKTQNRRRYSWELVNIRRQRSCSLNGLQDYVRAFHRQDDIGRDRGTLQAHGRPAAAQPPAPLQRLPHRPEKLKSCTMFVTEPNAITAEIHDRMPVILERTRFSMVTWCCSSRLRTRWPAWSRLPTALPSPALRRSWSHVSKSAA